MTSNQIQTVVLPALRRARESLVSLFNVANIASIHNQAIEEDKNFWQLLQTTKTELEELEAAFKQPNALDSNRLLETLAEFNVLTDKIQELTGLLARRISEGAR